MSQWALRNTNNDTQAYYKLSQEPKDLDIHVALWKAARIDIKVIRYARYGSHYVADVRGRHSFQASIMALLKRCQHDRRGTY